MRPLLIAGSVLVGIGMAGMVDAHHSIAAMYAREKSITLTGVVTRFEFVNPHPIVHLEATREGGNKESWTLEWSSKSRLDARGFTAETLRPGDEIVVSGGPARDGSRALFVGQLKRPADGFEYTSSQAPSRPPEPVP